MLGKSDLSAIIVLIHLGLHRGGCQTILHKSLLEWNTNRYFILETFEVPSDRDKDTIVEEADDIGLKMLCSASYQGSCGMLLDSSTDFCEGSH